MKRRRPARRGQTTVEYLLLMGAVAFFVVAFKKAVLEGMLVTFLPETIEAAKGEATSGGQNLGYYVNKSRATTSAP